MESQEKPDKMSMTVVQALAWLDNIGIKYRYRKDGDLWEFVYRGLYVLMMNDAADNEIGLCGPVIIQTDDGSEDEDTYKLIFDFASAYADEEFPNCDIHYVKDGLCQVSVWWCCEGKCIKLYKYRFVEMLKQIHKLQIDFHFALKCSEDFVFNPPEDILKDIDKPQDNG